MKAFNNDINNANEFILMIEKLSDINIWKTTRVDFLEWIDVFNVIDGILEQSAEQINQNDVKDKLKIISLLRFLKKIL